MAQKLTEGAILLCNKGTLPSKLAVTSQNFCRANNKLVATEKDKQAESNIPSFGACSITRGRCSPAVIMWQKTTEKDEINGSNILTDESTCQCMVGGKIAVQQKGHQEYHEIN